MPQYTIAKRIVQSVPGLREFGANAFTYLPDSMSPMVYRFMRKTIFRDMQQKLPVFRAAFQFMRDRGGARPKYLEFGVARGTSIITAHDLAQEVGFDRMPIFGFDSFQGLPNSEANVFEAGDMAYQEDIFRTFISKAGVPSELVTTVPGFYSESLAGDAAVKLGLQPGPYIVHIDCDLYESTKDALAFVQQFIAAPSVIIFDDYFDFDQKPDPENYGEKRAFREWSLSSSCRELCRTPGWNIAFAFDPQSAH